MLRIAVHREIPEDPEFVRTWNTLVSSMDRPQVFYTAEWALALQTAYRKSLKPFLLLGYEGDELIGVASLAADAANKNLAFLAANTSDYCDFLSAPLRRREFINAVFAELVRLNVASITLANLPADSPTAEALMEKHSLHRYHVFIRPAYACAQIELGSGEKRQELKNSLIRKKKLRRYLREMEREGPVSFNHLHSWQQIREELPAFADAHVARFRSLGKTSSLASNERRCFLEDLARRFEGQSVVTLSVLKIHDRPVAWNFGFQFQGSWFWYQPTFDNGQEENSPGHCLLSRIVIDACDLEGMNVVDLGLGAEGYKERFSNAIRPTLDVTLARSWSRHMREAVRYRAASLVKRSPKLEAALRRILQPVPLAGGATRSDNKNI